MKLIIENHTDLSMEDVLRAAANIYKNVPKNDNGDYFIVTLKVKGRKYAVLGRPNKKSDKLIFVNEQI